MNIILEQNKTVFDLMLELQGDLDNSLTLVLNKYGITSISEDLTGLILDVSYNTKNNYVNVNYTNNFKIVTGDINKFIHFKLTGAFDNGYDNGYDVVREI